MLTSGGPGRPSTVSLCLFPVGARRALLRLWCLDDSEDPRMSDTEQALIGALLVVALFLVYLGWEIRGWFL